ncbi:MAG: 4Fe-4S dicluster domain-containing protein [Acidobacteriia bacterium]|nr:4Fe-4S dicluster domain-containing protein [Terriglobia bacterium]
MSALLPAYPGAVFLPEAAQRVVFLALAIASVWLFYRTLNRRLFAHFPKPWVLPPGPLGKRLWRTFSEVFLQSRVIRDRPAAGIFHALVFWGFLAFAWVSTKHLSLGILGFDHAEESPGFYDAFAGVWALAVLLGICALSFRRFVMRPKALGKLSATSGVVAILISTLMVTYLLEWKSLSPPSTAWIINWWAHTLSFFALLVVIPQSKHLHLLLSPFAVFFRPETTSRMRPLREDGEDLGMVHFKDLAWKDVLDVNTCVECGRCTQFCPVNQIGGSLSPKEIILDMQHGLLHGGDLVAGTSEEKKMGSVWIDEKDLFQCLSCGACEYVCPVGIEHVGSKILDLRRGLVSEGRVSNEKVVKLFTTMERAPHNPWGIMQDTRKKFIEGKEFPIFDGKQEWLFWLGCNLNFDPHGQAVGLAMKQILNTAGISWGVLPRETCCGEPARRAGNEYLYQQLAEELTGTLAEHGVKNIVSCCPHCTTMLDKDYRQIGSYAALGIRVVHHSEIIEELLPKLPLKPAHESMTYHDPCYLARGRGITNAPRQILQSCGVSITEAGHHGENTQCCGAGGAQLFIADDRREQSSERVNQRRFAQLAETKAPTIAVACPYCPIMLRDAAGHAKRDDIAILDLAEIVASRINGSDGQLKTSG